MASIAPAQPELVPASAPPTSPDRTALPARRPYRIAHVSDPHLSRQYYREHLKSFKILLRTIIDNGFDHIVVSGDIVSTADPDDYYMARELFSTLGILDPAKLTVVPGNHDIFGGPHRAVDVLSFPSHIRSVDYMYRHKLFLTAFGELFEGATRLADPQPYPFLKRTGPFMLIGLNSIPRWSMRRNILGTNGALSPEQFDALQSLARSAWSPDSVPIVVMHHHMHDLSDDAVPSGLWQTVEARTMRLRKRRKTIRMFKEIGVSYVLHGHIHRNEVYDRQGVTFLNGAGSVCDDPVRFLKFNILEWDGRRVATHVRTLGIPYQTSTVSMALHRFGRKLTFPAFAAGS